MLKITYPVKAMEGKAASVLERLLREIPILKLKTLKIDEPRDRDFGIDITAQVNVGGESYLLICQVKSNGQPRFVRDAAHQLRNYVTHFKKQATPILIAPYLSAASRELCRENDVSFLDLEGNAHIAFGAVYIDCSVSDKPILERREFHSLFKPKSAQVLRILLRNPNQVWKVVDLAEVAKVSLGHVSNVRKALLDREWAEIVPEGIHLTSPDALLDGWKLAYRPSFEKETRFYTTLHGSAMERAIRDMFVGMKDDGKLALASFSAAHWIAPYARTGTQFIYADISTLECLHKALSLSSATKGENVIVMCPKDTGVFLDTYEPSPNIRCTSPVQTYLDLSLAGERGQEAAEYLRSARLSWQK
jgi:hypothetical protein